VSLRDPACPNTLYGPAVKWPRENTGQPFRYVLLKKKNHNAELDDEGRQPQRRVSVRGAIGSKPSRITAPTNVPAVSASS